MAIHVALHHVTDYGYDRAVTLAPQIVRLRPAPHCRTRILSYSQKIEPALHFVNWQQDAFANYQARLVFPEKTERFCVTVDLVAELAVYNPFDFFLDARAEHFPFRYTESERADLLPYLSVGDKKAGPRLSAVLRRTPQERMRTVDYIVALNSLVQQAVRYTIRLEPGVQTPEQTLELAVGSCRDSAWLLVNLMRRLGLAARFVSGYLIQLTADVKAIDGPSGAEQDFTDLHAWCEVYLPGAGWVGLDPTSGLLAGEGHIPLACTPQPSSAAPVEGGMDKCEVSFAHQMDVQRIYETPRVTKPYSEATWGAVLALGEQVDTALNQGDVRLTMGGEPTFVADTDRDAAEWNVDALGPTKRGYASELVQRLRDEYGAGGVLHFGQGKWYPGEQLPRWALSLYWRADGLPIWRRPELLADERVATAYTEADSERFLTRLCHELGLGHQTITPGYEDVFYYLWRERRLPVNVDPFDSRLNDELERDRLRRVFDQGLKKVVGYVLPLRVDEYASGAALSGTRWQTSPWFLRDERMYLLPGDSPMGYRLPLDSLPWSSAADLLHMPPVDPFAARAPLQNPAAAASYLAVQAPAAPNAASAAGAAYSADATNSTVRPSTRWAGQPPLGFGQQPSGLGQQSRVASTAAQAHSPSRAPQRFESSSAHVRTALCVETRGGVLYVFMPPLARLEDYLALLACIESAALACQLALVLEGYPPPRDPRLQVLQVTPDPGVIEVNIHPSHSWRELVQKTEFVYEAARQTRLCAEKFMLDGKHAGTGGGNHIVLGAARAQDSPFLRRPDLLGSLLSYWHNHPSLSYLFSGLFIGPTSQSPRLDEARNDQLFEIEIALAQIAKQQGENSVMAPWLLDRSLRNLLIDVTGNTHRSEFCIDKLYSPDSSSGRLGLLELRAFEMPPHARMSVVQQLLIRALIARFWAKPYSARLTRWGTELHDRFMLGHFVEDDFKDVLAELRQAGFGFDDAWFAPHLEFRFPLYGALETKGLTLELRGALEPWHVMGEEGSAGGTARYVDSSLERLEVKVTGFNESRYQVTCNTHVLPLQATGRVGEAVAGVRYRAWHPPSALHPSIGVHAPLVFDVVDTWMSRSIGGCQYHVTHPGGRSFDAFPINAYEAQSRRLTRFVRMGHTPGPIETRALERSKEHPFTLDLRR